MPLSIGVEVLGLDSVLRKLAEMPKRIDTAAKRGVYKAALLVLRETREGGFVKGSTDAGRNRPSHPTLITSRTGKMRQALNASNAEKDSSGWFSRVGYRKGLVDKYAPVHEANQPTTITAKRGPFLKFQVAGEWRQVRSVTIPNRRPLKNAFARTRQRQLDIIEQALTEAVQ